MRASEDGPIGDLANDFLRDCALNNEDPASYVKDTSLGCSLSFRANACPDAKAALKEAGSQYAQYLQGKSIPKSWWLTCNGKLRQRLAPTVFGVWEFCPKLLTLTNMNCDYEIDLERINSTAEMLDWIFQINHKNGKIYGETVVQDLLKAFDAIFAPQRNCCSFGSEKSFSGTDLAKAYAEKLKAYK